jgi:diguanylate cyclase (GGDEF)-like protein
MSFKTITTSGFQIVLACLLLFSIQCFGATQWPEKYTHLIDQISDDPRHVIDTLKHTPTVYNDPISNAYTLADAHLQLTLPQQALDYIDTGLGLLSEQSDEWYYYQLILLKARADDLLGNAEDAITTVEDALNWATQNQDIDTQIDGQITLGYLQLTLGHYARALDIFQTLKSQLQQQKANVDPIQIDEYIALVYEYQGEAQMAIPYFQSALNYYQGKQQRFQISALQYGLGRAYKNINNPEKGKLLLEQSATLAREINDEQGVAYALKEVGGIYVDQENFVSAKHRLLQAAAIFRKSNNPYMNFDVNLSLARLGIATGDHEFAEQHLSIAEQYITEESMQPHALAYKHTRAQLNALKGNYVEAYEQLESLIDEQRRFIAKNNNDRILELNAKFAWEQKEYQNKVLEEQNLRQQLVIATKQRTVTFVVVSSLLLLAICMLLLWLYITGKKQQKKLEQLANIDGLTGLASRRKTFENLETLYSLISRHKGVLCIAILDLDFFKKINDKFGHQTGDKVLIALGEIALTNFRKSDILGRIGGEEFLFAFPSTSLDVAKKMLFEFSQKIQNIPEHLDIKKLKTSVSIGIVEYTGDPVVTLDTLLASADQALYEAKNNGRAQIIETKVTNIENNR